MNKQECRIKNKQRAFKHQKAPVIDELDTSIAGAIIDDNTLEKSMLDDLYTGCKESTSKAPEKDNSYNGALILSIIISAVVAVVLTLSGAK